MEGIILLGLGGHAHSVVDSIEQEGKYNINGVFGGKKVVINANVKIGNMCIVNTGAIVEHDCVIGAGTTIRKDVEDYSMYTMNGGNAYFFWRCAV